MTTITSSVLPVAPPASATPSVEAASSPSPSEKAEKAEAAAAVHFRRYEPLDAVDAECSAYIARPSALEEFRDADVIERSLAELSSRRGGEIRLLSRLLDITSVPSGEFIDKCPYSSTLAPAAGSTRQRQWVCPDPDLGRSISTIVTSAVGAGYVISGQPYLMVVPTGANDQRPHVDSRQSGVYSAFLHVYNGHEVRTCVAGAPVSLRSWEVLLLPTASVHHGLANRDDSALTIRLCCDLTRRGDAAAAAAGASNGIVNATEVVGERCATCASNPPSHITPPMPTAYFGARPSIGVAVSTWAWTSNAGVNKAWRCVVDQFAAAAGVRAGRRRGGAAGDGSSSGGGKGKADAADAASGGGGGAGSGDAATATTAAGEDRKEGADSTDAAAADAASGGGRGDGDSGGAGSGDAATASTATAAGEDGKGADSADAAADAASGGGRDGDSGGAGSGDASGGGGGRDGTSSDDELAKEGEEGPPSDLSDQPWLVIGREPFPLLQWNPLVVIDDSSTDASDYQTPEDLLRACLRAVVAGNITHYNRPDFRGSSTPELLSTAIGAAGKYVSEDVVSTICVLLSRVASRHGTFFLPGITSHGARDLTAVGPRAFERVHCTFFWWSSLAWACQIIATCPRVSSFIIPVHLTPGHWAYIIVSANPQVPFEVITVNSWLPQKAVDKECHRGALKAIGIVFYQHLSALVACVIPRLAASPAALGMREQRAPRVHAVEPPYNGINGCGLLPVLTTMLVAVWTTLARERCSPTPASVTSGGEPDAEQWRRRAFAALLSGVRLDAEEVLSTDPAGDQGADPASPLPESAAPIPALPPLTTESATLFAPIGGVPTPVIEAGAAVPPAAAAAGAAAAADASPADTTSDGPAPAVEPSLRVVEVARWWRRGPAQWLRDPPNAGRGLVAGMTLRATLRDIATPPAHGLALASFSRNPRSGYREPFVIRRDADMRGFPSAMLLRCALPDGIDSTMFLPAVMGGTAALINDGIWDCCNNLRFHQFWKNVWAILSSATAIPTGAYLLAAYGKAYWVAGRTSQPGKGHLLTRWPPDHRRVRDWAIGEGYFAKGSLPTPMQLSVLVPEWLSDHVLNAFGVVNPPPPPSATRGAAAGGGGRGAAGGGRGRRGGAAGVSGGRGAAGGRGRRGGAEPPQPEVLHQRRDTSTKVHSE